MSRLGVDLLVVDHKTPRQLADLLESIHADGIDINVWIGLVDSPESRDVARDYAATAPHPTHVVEWVDNVGYNRALNRLGTLGHHPVIGCLNADLILNHVALHDLVTKTATTPQWGVVGPRQTNREGRLVAAGIFGEQTKPRHRGWKALDGYRDDRDDCVYVAGSALFLRRDVWTELTNCRAYQTFCHEPGPWLDTQHFYGDSWLSLHAQAHGYRAVYLGSVTITHLLGAKASRERDHADRDRFRAACDTHEIPHE